MSTSEVTVVIPVWDRYVNVLLEAVASVQSQTRAVKAIVIVDNASTEALPEVAPEIEVIRLARRETLGGARNRAIDRINTPYCLFLDADDALAPEAVGRMVRALDGDPSANVCAGRRLLRNVALGQIQDSPWPSDGAYRRVGRPLEYALQSLVINQIPTNAALLRTSTLKESGGWGDHPINEDWSLCMAFAFRGRAILLREATHISNLYVGGLGEQQLTRADLAADCHRIRRRAFHDREVPVWLKLLWPLVILMQARRVRTQAASGVVDFSELAKQLGGATI